MAKRATKRAKRPAEGVEFFRSAATAALGLPFADAVRAGDLLFVSGQIGNLPGTLTLAPGGIRPEADRALSNLGAVLAARGLAPQDVVKCTIFLADMAEWKAFNESYLRFFGERLPARSALAASGLALGARVELDCVAVFPRRRQPSS